MNNQDQAEDAPKKLGITLAQALEAIAEGRAVRYWPLRDGPCVPFTGIPWAAEARNIGRKEVPVIWLTGKAGFVCGSHCQIGSF